MLPKSSGDAINDSIQPVDLLRSNDATKHYSPAYYKDALIPFADIHISKNETTVAVHVYKFDPHTVSVGGTTMRIDYSPPRVYALTRSSDIEVSGHYTFGIRRERPVCEYSHPAGRNIRYCAIELFIASYQQLSIPDKNTARVPAVILVRKTSRRFFYYRVGYRVFHITAFRIAPSIRRGAPLLTTECYQPRCRYGRTTSRQHVLHSTLFPISWRYTFFHQPA